MYRGVRGGSVGWGTPLQVGRSRIQFPVVSLEFLHLHNPAGRNCGPWVRLSLQ